MSAVAYVTYRQLTDPAHNRLHFTASKLTTSNNKDGEQTRACISESSAQIEGIYTVVDNSIDYKRIATGT